MTIISNKENRIVILIMLLTAFFMALCIQYGHDWGDDFALYIEQAKAITNGSIKNLYTGNKLAMQHSSTLIGPYLYPNGFPLLLSPIYYLLGIHFIVMKAFCSLFFILSIPIIYKLFKPYFSSNSYVFLIIPCFACHISFITFSDNILSDFPFFFISFLSLQLMKTHSNICNQFALGLCIFFTYFVRDIGIVLLPTLFVYQISLYFSKSILRKNKSNLAIPYVIFFLLFAVVNIFLPKGGENHIELLLNKVSIQSIKSNILYYAHLLSIYFFFKNYWLFIPVLLIVIVGLLETRKEATQFIAFTFFFSIILIIWPGVQGVRFIFPIIPFVLFFLLKGAVHLFNNYQINLRYLYIVFVLFILRSTLYTIKQTVLVRPENSNQSYSIEMVEIYDYIKKNIPERAIIGFFKPRALRLFTCRNSIETDEVNFEKSIASYLLIDKKVANKSISKYPKVYETTNYILVAKSF